jgi:hypothetical protein
MDKDYLSNICKLNTNNNVNKDKYGALQMYLVKLGQNYDYQL